MADDLFESAWLKWAWAVVNANVLGDNVNTFASQPERKLPVLLFQDYDAKRHCIILSIADIKNPFPPLWGLLLGDAVHDFRCVLDHVAWALYKRGKTPNLSAKKERRIYFPISTVRKDFNDSLRVKLPGVHRADIAIVRRYQPYIAGKRNMHRHILLALESLSNRDKHRTIQPVVAVPEGGNFKILSLKDSVYRRFAPGLRQVLEPGTELARFYVKKTGPDPEIDVEPRFTLDPAINERLPLQEFLRRTMDITRRLLREFSDPPQSAIAVLGKPIA